jgi:hypothetical protein
MTLTQFNQLLDDRHKAGTLFDANGHLESIIIEEYTRDKKKLKDEFFEGIESDLNQDNIKNLSYYLGLLIVDPFEKEDNERFQGIMIQSIEKLENANSSSDISELANFIWVLLDHMLHNWTMSNKKQMIDKLKKFKISLQPFESGHKDDVELLYQKLGHFGVE